MRPAGVHDTYGPRSTLSESAIIAAEFYNFEFQLILTYRNKYELCNFGQTHMHRLRRDTSKRGADALPPSCAAAARDPRQRATSGFVKLSLACI